MENELEKDEENPRPVNVQMKAPSEEPNKTFVPRPSFPSRFAKSKKEEREKKIHETFHKVEVNIPLLDVTKQIPRYAKFFKELCNTKCKLIGNEKIQVDENVSVVIKRNYHQSLKIQVCLLFLTKLVI